MSAYPAGRAGRPNGTAQPSCGRNPRRFEFYGPLSPPAIGDSGAWGAAVAAGRGFG